MWKPWAWRLVHEQQPCGTGDALVGACHRHAQVTPQVKAQVRHEFGGDLTSLLVRKLAEVLA